MSKSEHATVPSKPVSSKTVRASTVSPSTVPPSKRPEGDLSRKGQSHSRIVSAASRLFRRDGQLATGIDKVMSEAGLTHGGFYAHFRDKTVLFAEALDHAFDEAEQNLLFRGLDTLRGKAYVSAATKRYLATSHRNRPAEGCAIASLGAEVARAPVNVRRRFTSRVEKIASQIAGRLDGPDADLRALNLLSLWVGTLVVGRNLPEKRAQELFDYTQKSAERLAR
jgi:TetR/AcrR family transcriptional repressor of nem operon